MNDEQLPSQKLSDFIRNEEISNLDAYSMNLDKFKEELEKSRTPKSPKSDVDFCSKLKKYIDKYRPLDSKPNETVSLSLAQRNTTYT